MPEHPLSSTAVLSGWRKSSYSGPEAGSCLEVLDGHHVGVPVRDSKVVGGPVVVFSTVGWASFIATLRD